MVCLSPTYELALQTGQVAEKMGQFCPEIKIGYAVRGERGEKFYQKKKNCQPFTPYISMKILPTVLYTFS